MFGLWGVFSKYIIVFLKLGVYEEIGFGMRNGSGGDRSLFFFWGIVIG